MNNIIKHRLPGVKVLMLIVSLSLFLPVVAQPKKEVQKGWRFALQRKDGKEVIFQLEKNTAQGERTLAVVNAEEKIKITDVTSAGDSLFFSMPAFEASFRVKLQP
jgi:hypothetical protein